MRTKLVLLATVALSVSCGHAQKDGPNRLVQRTDYAVGASWARRQIGGRDFVPFDAIGFPRWGTKGWEKGAEIKAMPVFRDMAFYTGGGVSGKIINDVYQPKIYSKDWRIYPPEKVSKEPYGPEEMFGNAPKDRLFIAGPWNCRPAYFLHDGYNADRAAYAKWKAAHPNFLGMKYLAEYDNDINAYQTYVVRLTNDVVRETLLSRLPLAKTGRESMEQLRTVLRRETEMCFGEKELTWGLNSVSCTLAHRYAAAGLRGIIYEAAMNATSGPWVFGTAFTRGAARQWGIPFVWYCAHYVGKGYTRDGKPGSGEMEWPGSWAGYGKIRTPVKWKGAGRSLLKREMAYGAFAGASGLWPENAHFYLYADGPNGKKVPSPLAEDYNEVYLMAKDGKCGVPYTPVAILSSLYVNCSRHGYVSPANLSQMAFLYTLVPAKVPADAERAAYHHSDRRKGDLGCLYNSRFGEIWDVIAPDAGQPTADLVKALSSYKAAFLVGHYGDDSLDTRALVEYMKGGGTLFISSDQKKFFPDIPQGDVGKGRLFVVKAEGMIGTDHPIRSDKDAWTKLVSGQFDFPEVERLLARVQDETMPCRVTGDCQWGVNKTASGWRFWAFNNKGVTKFVYESEDLDPKATSHVAVAFKESAGGARFEFDIPAGGIFCKDVN